MFLSKSGNSKIEAVIGPETQIEGNVRTNASIRIDGKVKGEVHADSVIIGNSGVILGNVTANKVTVNGKVKGNIAAAAILELLATGQVLGDIKTAKLTISDGATFEGNCQMLRSDGKVIEMRPDQPNGEKTLKVIAANSKR